MELLVRSKTFRPKSARLLSIVCSLLLLTGCGGSSTNLDRETKAAESTKDAYDNGIFESTESNWRKMKDGVTDFGDRQMFFFNTQENSSDDTFRLVPGCTAGLFEFWIQTDFYLVDNNTGVAAIRLNGGEPRMWNLDKRVDAGINEVTGRREYAVRFENGKKLFEKLEISQTFSVQLSTGSNTFNSATFALGGIEEVSSDLSSAGCD
jgi:hypothetical protein